MDAGPAAEGPEAVPPQADARLGRGPERHRLREHQVLRPLDREAGGELGRPARRHQEHLRQARHPRGGEAAPGRRCRRAVRVRGRVSQDPGGPGGEGRHLPGHRYRAQGAPGAVPGVFRHGDPGRRQQVRRAEHRGLVRRQLHLRAEGRARGDPAAGLLPDQHREHGPVRADPDHRRRGRPRALRRGLHRADLLLRLAALGGRRDHREARRPLPLHHDPELVEQRLQPGHQAGRGAGGREHGVGRRQHRIQGHDEVPGRLPDGRARQGRDAVRRVRRRRPAPGRGRQDGALRAEHVLTDHLQVGRALRRADVLPWPGAGPGGRGAFQVHRQVRRAAGGHGQPVRHLPLRGRPRGRCGDGARGQRLQDLRGPALLPDEPRHDRGRGGGHHRPRLRRADRPRAADGIRARAEPADRAANGGGGRLMSALQGAVESTAPVSRLHAHRAEFPVPTGREEEWRFTPLRRLRGLHAAQPLAAGKIHVGVDAAPGVSAVLAQRGDPRHATDFEPVDRISATAFASYEEALVVTVPPDAEDTTPTVISVRGDDASGAAYGHTRISLGDNARAVVVVDHQGSATYADNVEIVVGDGAFLTLVSVQDWADDAVHVSAHQAVLGRDARLQHTVVSLGGDVVRMAPAVRYAGPGGDAELLGVYFADAGQHLEHRLFVDHAQPDCRSRVDYKGALQGEAAHTVWIGDVLIRPEATGTDTYERNRNLLLTDGARADSVPNLEILTGEVVGAGHASASGRLEDHHLFYLMARGIPLEEARRLVIRGFFGELIAKIAVPELRDRITEAIEAELAAGTPEVRR